MSKKSDEVMKKPLFLRGFGHTAKSVDTREMIPHVGFSATKSYSLHSKKESQNRTVPFHPLLFLSLTTFPSKERKKMQSFSFATIILSFYSPSFSQSTYLWL